jgi:predicted secreted hydrolase
MPQVTLPADDAVQRGPLIQWWYWTGQLRAEDGRAFGYEIVFFVGATPHLLFCGQMAQSAISDLGAQRFVDQERVFVAAPAVLTDRFQLATPCDAIRATGGGGDDTLYASTQGYELSLHVKATKPATIHYGGQDHAYKFGGDTLYYSRETMRAAGTLKLPDGTTLAVEGDTWFDRQWGDLAFAVLLGWQWFALQLDDGTRVMLFDFYRYHKERYGSFGEPDGTTIDLGPRDFEIDVLDWWTSPRSHIQYPHGWRVRTRGKTWIVKPKMADQELTGRFWLGPQYWEGACEMLDEAGATVGSAYVELVGFSAWERPIGATLREGALDADEQG